METVTLAHCHRYYNNSDREALGFLREQRRLQQLQAARLRHVAKYRHWFERTPEVHVPLLFSVPCHLATALIESLVAAPLFFILFDGLVAPGMAHALTSYLPLFTFLGVTLAVGYNLHRYRRQPDAIDPEYVHANSGVLWTALGLGALYLTFLLLLMNTARELLQTNEFAPYLIVGFGLAELALGYFAACGWAILYAYVRLRSNQYHTVAAQRRMHEYAHRCEEHYQYYLERIQLLSRTVDRQSLPRINGRIRAALAFSQVESCTKFGDEDRLSSAA